MFRAINITSFPGATGDGNEGIVKNLRGLTEMSQWILENHLQQCYDGTRGVDCERQQPYQFWKHAFDACDTMEDFETFLEAHHGEEEAPALWLQWDRIAATPLPPKISRPVVLPTF